MATRELCDSTPAVFLRGTTRDERDDQSEARHAGSVAYLVVDAARASPTADERLLRGRTLWHADTMTMTAATMCEAFQATVAREGDAVALRTKANASRVTWREYGERVEAGRRLGFMRWAFAPGDSVGILMINRPEFNVVDVAAMHLGATPFSMYLTSSHRTDRVLPPRFGRARARDRTGAAAARSGTLASSTSIVVEEPRRIAGERATLTSMRRGAR